MDPRRSSVSRPHASWPSGTTTRLRWDGTLGLNEWRVPTFAEVAAEYMREVLTTKNVKMRLTWTRAVEVYAAGIAQKRVDEIGVGDALAVLRPIWTTKFETASRVRGKLQRVMTYAKGRGWRSGENPFAWTDKLSGLLPTGQRATQHYKSMPYEEVPAFVADLKTRSGLSPISLQLLIATALRSVECLSLRWSDVDFDGRVLTIPAERMKGGRTGHTVPLSTWAIEILETLHF